MPCAKDVRPKRWKDIIELYDDGEYSAIWGTYKYDDGGGEGSCLGVRWNGKDKKIGYPSQGSYPLWYVEPEFLTESILSSILRKLEKVKLSKAKKEKYIKHTNKVLEAFKKL